MKKTIPFIVYSFSLLLLTAFSGCKKEALPISETPAIKFLSISPNPAVKYQDEVSIELEYTDGDGDLGENTPDVKNLFVTDSRNNVVSAFRINQLAPTGSSIIITGKLKITLTPQGFIDDNNTSETTIFSIYVTDRAGHSSNTVQTSALTIQD